MWTSQCVARSSDAHASYPVFVHRLARLLHASFRPRLQTTDLAAAIALAFCYPSPPSGWGRTFTSRLLSMPSTQRSRFAADAFACIDTCVGSSLLKNGWRRGRITHMVAENSYIDDYQ